MKTFSGENAGSKILPLFDNAQKSIWVVSPWLGKEYAERLARLSQKGLEVRIITSRVDYNLPSIEILRACENPNLHFLILEKERASDRGVYVHAKIYLTDQHFAVSGSANLTHSGLYSNVENLSIAETEEEVQKIEADFMRIWLKYEKKGLSHEALSSGTSFSLRRALPLTYKYEANKNRQKLVYYPYYFVEYLFRGSVRSPPLLFDDKGFLVMDAVTRQIYQSTLITNEINANQEQDYVVDTQGKYDLEITPMRVTNFREANELVLDFIIKKNTRTYNQRYGSRYYEKLYVPRRYEISFIKSKFVQVPIWHLSLHESDGFEHKKTVLAASGNVWTDLVVCPSCHKTTSMSDLSYCDNCRKFVCSTCGKNKGLLFKKILCPACYCLA